MTKHGATACCCSSCLASNHQIQMPRHLNRNQPQTKSTNRPCKRPESGVGFDLGARRVIIVGERRNTGPPHLATASCSWMQQSTRASCSCIQQTTRASCSCMEQPPEHLAPASSKAPEHLAPASSKPPDPAPPQPQLTPELEESSSGIPSTS